MPKRRHGLSCFGWDQEGTRAAQGRSMADVVVVLAVLVVCSVYKDNYQ